MWKTIDFPQYTQTFPQVFHKKKRQFRTDFPVFPHKSGMLQTFSSACGQPIQSVARAFSDVSPRTPASNSK